MYSIIFEKKALDFINKLEKDLKELFKINPTPIRKGRSFPRVFHQFRKKFYIKKKRAV